MRGGRGVGPGVEAREELAVLEARPLTPLGVTGAGERFTPHDPTGFGASLGDIALPRDGKSPSERKLGGVDGFLGRLGEAVLGDVESGWESASN